MKRLLRTLALLGFAAGWVGMLLAVSGVRWEWFFAGGVVWLFWAMGYSRRAMEHKAREAARPGWRNYDDAR
jgi:hypothetical protein